MSINKITRNSTRVLQRLQNRRYHPILSGAIIGHLAAIPRLPGTHLIGLTNGHISVKLRSFFRSYPEHLRSPDLILITNPRISSPSETHLAQTIISIITGSMLHSRHAQLQLLHGGKNNFHLIRGGTSSLGLRTIQTRTSIKIRHLKLIGF